MDQERIESIKAGGLAALMGASIGALLGALHPSLMSSHTYVLRIAVATVSAFLFGVTYRYIVRNDSNPHLRSGAVGAFALTRSLGQLENIAPTDLVFSDTLSLVLPIAESFGLFICIRLVLDWGLKQQWFQPFESE
ncbi:MAG: hypothetical protein F6K11_16935 [Leptolyngbya sp. SIO3F4]|nr:hypothetical protein [Leptolyngbya sp. SIO3F4]